MDKFLTITEQMQGMRSVNTFQYVLKEEGIVMVIIACVLQDVVAALTASPTAAGWSRPCSGCPSSPFPSPVKRIL